MGDAREWFYPGGYIYTVGNRPPRTALWSHDGWELFFVFNPDEQETAHLEVRFYYEDESPRDAQWEVPPAVSVLFGLFRPEFDAFTRGGNVPFGLRLRSDRPVYPHVTRAEYEPWSNMTPGAMFGVSPYPGPLGDETTWFYADGLVLNDPDQPVIQQEWISILNPSPEATALTLTFYLPDGPVSQALELGGERVALVRVEDLATVVPKGVPYGVRVQGDRPIVVQQTRRTLEQGGYPSTRAIFGTMAIPWREAQR
jgi:hypothetical protein